MPAPVQTAEQRNTIGATSYSITFGVTPTVGNTLYFAISYAYNGTFTPPAGLTADDSSLSATISMRTFHRVVQSGDGQTWTFTLGTSGNGGLIAYEVPGTLDVHNITTTTGSDPSITTTVNGELVIAGGIARDAGAGGSVSWTLGSGYTQDFLNNAAVTATVGDIGEHQTQSSSGTISTNIVDPLGNGGAGSYVTLFIAAFKQPVLAYSDTSNLLNITLANRRNQPLEAAVAVGTFLAWTPTPISPPVIPTNAYFTQTLDTANNIRQYRGSFADIVEPGRVLTPFFAQIVPNQTLDTAVSIRQYQSIAIAPVQPVFKPVVAIPFFETDVSTMNVAASIRPYKASFGDQSFIGKPVVPVPVFLADTRTLDIATTIRYYKG